MIGTRHHPRLHARLCKRPAVFLSASIVDPRRKDEAGEPPAPDPVVLQAVLELCYEVFARDWTLVFGGHPVISPMVLSAMRSLAGGRARRRRHVICFQTEFFANLFPEATRDLWREGWLLTTAAVPARAPDREASLERMRTAMLSLPNLRGAVFIGGMKGVGDEARLFARLQKGNPRYAIPATGSMAAALFAAAPRAYSGGNRSLEASLRAGAPSADIACMILDDLERRDAK